MNRTVSNTIAAAIQVLTFFFVKYSTSFCIRMLIIIIASESGYTSNVTYNWGSQKSDSQKGVAKQQTCKKGLREAKSLVTSDLQTFTIASQPNFWSQQIGDTRRSATGDQH